MSTSVLCQNVIATQAAPINQGLVIGTEIGTTTPPPGTGLPAGSNCVQPATVENVTNPQNQAFQAIVTCSAGNCSATVQLMASTDGVNWAAYGTAITVSSGASPNVVNSNGSQPWEYFTAYVTAISGTNAAVQVKMST